MKLIPKLLAFLIICVVGLAIGCGNHRRHSHHQVPEIVEVTVGTPVTATFEKVGEVDVYCVELEGGSLYRVSTSNLSADVDTVLSLFDEQGRLLLQNDDANDSLASEIYFWSPVDAKYCIHVTDKDTTRPEGMYDFVVDFVGITGPQGPPGPPGADGQDGQDGTCDCEDCQCEDCDNNDDQTSCQGDCDDDDYDVCQGNCD